MTSVVMTGRLMNGRRDVHGRHPPPHRFNLHPGAVGEPELPVGHHLVARLHAADEHRQRVAVPRHLHRAELRGARRIHHVHDVRPAGR